MKKLTDYPMHLQIFLAVTAAVSLVVILTIALWLVTDDNNRHERAFATFCAMMAEDLPPASAPPAQQSAAIDSWISRAHTRFALFSPDGQLISRPLQPAIPAPQRVTAGGYFDDLLATRFVWQLPDQRLLVVQFSRDRVNRSLLFIFVLIALACAVALTAFPVIRRLTARLEQLQRSVESLGDGHFNARAAIGGRDEVGLLAASFNRSASQIEALLNTQKTMLANASHELRSPLTRIRMAVTLPPQQQAQAREELERSVGELDALVEEILTYSRLEIAEVDRHHDFSACDITAIAAEESARVAVELDADHIIAVADERLMRRLMRNLLENALKYGGPSVRVTLRLQPDAFFLFSVSDRGPGIPAAERERIFHPFYRLSSGENAPGGSGLGLALVRAIAGHHGGAVWSEDRPGGGTTFCVRLPLHAIGER